MFIINIMSALGLGAPLRLKPVSSQPSSSLTNVISFIHEQITLHYPEVLTYDTKLQTSSNITLHPIHYILPAKFTTNFSRIITCEFCFKVLITYEFCFKF